MKIGAALPFAPTSVRSCESGKLEFEIDGDYVRTKVKLGINDIVLFEK